MTSVAVRSQHIAIRAPQMPRQHANIQPSERDWHPLTCRSKKKALYLRSNGELCNAKPKRTTKRRGREIATVAPDADSCVLSASWPNVWMFNFNMAVEVCLVSQCFGLFLKYAPMTSSQGPTLAD